MHFDGDDFLAGLSNREAFTFDLILFLGEEITVLLNASVDFFDDLLLSKFGFAQLIDFVLELLVGSDYMVIGVDGLVEFPL